MHSIPATSEYSRVIDSYRDPVKAGKRDPQKLRFYASCKPDIMDRGGKRYRLLNVSSCTFMIIIIVQSCISEACFVAWLR